MTKVDLNHLGRETAEFLRNVACLSALNGRRARVRILEVKHQQLLLRFTVVTEVHEVFVRSSLRQKAKRYRCIDETAKENACGVSGPERRVLDDQEVEADTSGEQSVENFTSFWFV